MEQEKLELNETFANVNIQIAKRKTIEVKLPEKPKSRYFWNKFEVYNEIKIGGMVEKLEIDNDNNKIVYCNDGRIVKYGNMYWRPDDNWIECDEHGLSVKQLDALNAEQSISNLNDRIVARAMTQLYTPEERKVFHVDMGNLHPSEVEQYLEDNKESFQKIDYHSLQHETGTDHLELNPATDEWIQAQDDQYGKEFMQKVTETIKKPEEFKWNLDEFYKRCKIHPNVAQVEEEQKILQERE